MIPGSTGLRIAGSVRTILTQSREITANPATTLRRIILEQSKRAGVGHIGSALSVVEILLALDGVVRRQDPRPATRDRFVLSKGHAALALYGLLFLRGRLGRAALDTYCADGSLLGVHPEHQLEGVDFSTGSLGHGLTMAAGSALGARISRSGHRAFCLMSDAELNEGSVWEAVMFAAHHRLSNLVAVVDENGQQALGPTKDVLSLDPVSERFRAFGWDCHDVNGHDLDAIIGILGRLDFDSGPPHAVIAHTTFGKGVSFMEGRVKWHYWPMNDEEYRIALSELPV